MAERSEEDVLRGILRVQVGGKPRDLPELAIEPAEAWVARVWAVLSGDIGGLSLDSIADGAAVATTSVAKILDLVAEYDQGDVLGGRPWLATHATPREVYAIFREALRAALPFVDDLLTLVREVRSTGLLAAFAPPRSGSSTNGHTPRGDSVLVDSAGS